jgi:hypothetical protein
MAQSKTKATTRSIGTLAATTSQSNTAGQVDNQPNRTRNTAVNSGNTQSNQSWKGQSTYNGADKNNGSSANNASRNPSTTNSRANSSVQANTQPVKPDRGYSSAPASTAVQRTNSGQSTPSGGRSIRRRWKQWQDRASIEPEGSGEHARGKRKQMRIQQSIHHQSPTLRLFLLMAFHI